MCLKLLERGWRFQLHFLLLVQQMPGLQLQLLNQMQVQGWTPLQQQLQQQALKRLRLRLLSLMLCQG
jgi:hypothetical protein